MPLLIKQIAESRGINMSQLQRRTGLTMGQIRRYWHNEGKEGQLDGVSLEALERIAKELQVLPSDLIGPAELYRIDPPYTVDDAEYNAVHLSGLGDALLTHLKPGSDIPVQPTLRHWILAPEDWRDRVTERVV